MVSNKIYKIGPKEMRYMGQIQKWYDEVGEIQHTIKVSWLNGMMKKSYYDEHERNMLNKMVKKYNETLV